MGEPEHDEYWDYDESDECWECGGEGGWNSCMEDCCMAVGGEEGCTDPICWRRCPNCRGKGFIEPAVGDAQPELREVLAEALEAIPPENEPAAALAPSHLGDGSK